MHFLWTRYEGGIRITEEVAREFIHQYRDTDVTDFVMNVNGTVASFDSGVYESFCDKYVKTQENGMPVCYRETFAAAAYDAYKVQGLDIYKIWIAALREIHIRPWASIQVNDCHYNGYPTHLVKSEFVEQHPALWRVTGKAADGYFDKCFNFLLPQVRNRVLEFIKEVLIRYDVDGLELDFTREMLCFPVGMEAQGRAVMNGFVREIADLVDGFAKERQHAIRLSALVAESPSVNYQMGLDVYRWIREGIFDAVVPIVRWETIYYEMPVEEWKMLACGTQVAIGAGQQLLVQPYRGYRHRISTPEMAFGQAYANLAKGADFLYLYNYMDMREPGLAEVSHSHDIRNREQMARVLCSIGTADKLKKQERWYILTYSDTACYWDNVHCRLPIVFSSDGQSEYIKISTGQIVGEEQAFLALGIRCAGHMGPEDMAVYCNGTNITCDGEYDFMEELNETGVVHYKFPFTGAEGSLYQVFQIYSRKPCTICYAQVVVKEWDEVLEQH